MLGIGRVSLKKGGGEMKGQDGQGLEPSDEGLVNYPLENCLLRRNRSAAVAVGDIWM